MNAKKASRKAYKVLANSQLDAEIENMKDLGQGFKVSWVLVAAKREDAPAQGSPLKSGISPSREPNISTLVYPVDTLQTSMPRVTS